MLIRQRGRVRLATVAAVVAAGTAAAVTSGAPALADQARSAQLWVLDAVGAPAAWNVTQGKGVTVAVIDSGVNPHVSDLAGSVITGPDYSGVRTSPSNPNWGLHGTWMASLIAGHGHGPGERDGILGVAPHAKVLSIRVITDKGDPDFKTYQGESNTKVQTELATAIRYAATHGAQVLSLSLGYGAPSGTVRSAVQYALSRGAVVVASSGNSGESKGGNVRQAPYSFPADYAGVLGVGAVSASGQPAGFSSANLSVQVAAPGVDVPAQGKDGGYWTVTGTSPACALTAGVAALIKAKYPTLSPALVVQAITTTTRNRPHGGYDDQVGFGTVDAPAALRAAGVLARDQSVSQGFSTTGSFGGGAAAVTPPPVQPRGAAHLVLAWAFAVACLVLALVTGFRLALAPASQSGRSGRGGRGGRPSAGEIAPGEPSEVRPWGQAGPREPDPWDRAGLRELGPWGQPDRCRPATPVQPPTRDNGPGLPGETRSPWLPWPPPDS